MDNRITKKRFAEMWAYDWIKMLVALAAAILVWCLVFDMAAPRLLKGQDFTVFIFPTISSEAEAKISDDFDDKTKGIFSYDVLSKYASTFAEKAIAQLMTTRAATHEGDIIILDSYMDTENKLAGNFESVIDGGYSIFVIDDLFAAAITYVSGFTATAFDVETVKADLPSYAAQIKTAEIDYNKVYEAFKTRKKKDNRYKSQAEYKSGAEQDVVRIKNTRDTAVKLVEAFYRLDTEYDGKENNPLRANYKRGSAEALTNSEAEVEKEAKTYGINLGGVEIAEIDGVKIAKSAGDKNIGNVYRKAGSEKPTSDGVVLCVFDYTKWQPDLQYETLFFIEYVLGEYTNLFA